MRSSGQLRRNRFFWVFAACWAWLGLGAVCVAQTRPRPSIEFEVDQSAWAMRGGAPVPLRLKITCSASGIMEGDLEIQALDATGTMIAAIRVPDQVYSPGRQEVEYLLPIQSHRLQNSLVITCLFREKNGPTYPSTGQLVLPSRRAFVVPIVRGPVGADSADDFAWLMLENRCPKHSSNSGFSPLLTFTPRIRGADLPRDPLKYLPHDIVVVEAAGFTELVGPQVQALDLWVKGGGSLFLQIGYQDLSSEQQVFLDRLIAKNPNVLQDIVEETMLIPTIVGTAGVPLEYGFGQVWLTTARSWPQATEADRLAAMGHLWRLRPEHLATLSQSGELSLELAKLEQQSQWNQYQYSGMYPGAPMQSGIQSVAEFEQDQILARWQQMLIEARSTRPGEMIESLMPRDVQAVPVWLLSTIILAYIAAIGFGDYIILGKLKRRRWTWITFPVMTLAVSLLCIGTAKGYLGTSQELSAVEFRDVADDGSICRVQRFELLFRSSSGRSVTQLDNVAYTPVARQNVGNLNPRNGMADIETQAVVVDGIPTAQATVIQQIEQWKPQLNRTVSFPRDKKAPLTLPTPGPGMKMSSPEFASQLDGQIRAALPNTLNHLFFASQGIVAGANMPNTLNNMINNPEGARIYQLMLSCQTPGISQNQSSVGLLTLFNQISPCADAGLADMVVATPGHEVLCVAVREANNELVIYRWRFPTP